MKIEHLYYFLVVANTNSINKAAQKLFISQQHLSRIMNGLEEDLHIQLLRRTSTGIELTEKGKVFSQFAEKIVNNYQEMQSYFYLDALPAPEHTEEILGSARIAFPFFFSLFLNDFMKGLHQIHPGVTLRYFEDSGDYQAESLRNSNMLHVVVEHAEQLQNVLHDDSELTAYYIGETGVSFCVNRQSPLAQKPILSQTDINTQLITCYPQMTYNQLLKDANVLFVSSNIYQHLDSVVHNGSICFAPSYIQTGIQKQYPDIVMLPFERQYTVPIYIVHNKNMLLTDADKAVIRYAAQYMQELSKAANPLSGQS